MKITKLSASLLCFVLLLSVSACHNGDHGTKDTDRTGTESASEAAISTDDGALTEPDVSATAESNEDSHDSEPLTAADPGSTAAEPDGSDTEEPITQAQEATETAGEDETTPEVSDTIPDARTEAEEPVQSDTEERHTGIVLPDIDI